MNDAGNFAEQGDFSCVTGCDKQMALILLDSSVGSDSYKQVASNNVFAGQMMHVSKYVDFLVTVDW